MIPVLVHDLFHKHGWPMGLDMLSPEAKQEIWEGLVPEHLPTLCAPACCSFCTRHTPGAPRQGLPGFLHCCGEELLCDIMACEILVPRHLFVPRLLHIRQPAFPGLEAPTNLRILAEEFAVDLHTINMALALWWQSYFPCICQTEKKP